LLRDALATSRDADLPGTLSADVLIETKGKTYTGPPFDTDSFRSDLTFDVVRVGLNSRLGNL